MADRAKQIAEEHLKQSNPSLWDGKGNLIGGFTTMIVTHSIDKNTELDIHFEKDEEGWCHVCELRDKESEELMAVESGYGINSVKNLTDTIMSVCKELEDVRSPKITDLHEFIKALAEMMTARRPDIEISAEQIKRNNDVSCAGIIAKKKDMHIRSVVPVEEYFTQYQNGAALDQIFEDVIAYLNSAMSQQSLEAWMTDFTRAEEKIYFTLVNAQKNNLSNVPHRMWNDLAIVYHISVLAGTDTLAGIKITNENMRLWNISEPRLYSTARRNTPKLFPENITSMANLYVITNKRKVRGASVILYDGVLEKLGKILKNDFYIFPSSVHEVLVMPTSAIDNKRACSLVCDANASVVRPEEFLSDNVYIYHVKEEYMEIVQ